VPVAASSLVTTLTVAHESIQTELFTGSYAPRVYLPALPATCGAVHAPKDVHVAVGMSKRSTAVWSDGSRNSWPPAPITEPAKGALPTGAAGKSVMAANVGTRPLVKPFLGTTPVLGPWLHRKNSIGTAGV